MPTPPVSVDALVAQAVAALPPLCTLSETATALRQSTRTIKRMIADRRLMAARLHNEGSAKVLIPRAEIERLLRQSFR